MHVTKSGQIDELERLGYEALFIYGDTQASAKETEQVAGFHATTDAKPYEAALRAKGFGPEKLLELIRTVGANGYYSSCTGAGHLETSPVTGSAGISEPASHNATAPSARTSENILPREKHTEESTFQSHPLIQAQLVRHHHGQHQFHLQAGHQPNTPTKQTRQAKQRCAVGEIMRHQISRENHRGKQCSRNPNCETFDRDLMKYYHLRLWIKLDLPPDGEQRFSRRQVHYSTQMAREAKQKSGHPNLTQHVFDRIHGAWEEGVIRIAKDNPFAPNDFVSTENGIEHQGRMTGLIPWTSTNEEAMIQAGKKRRAKSDRRYKERTFLQDLTSFTGQDYGVDTIADIEESSYLFRSPF